MNKNVNTFQRANEVDKERFAELLLAAKGGRTMQQFAKVCNVSPSTFTRIIQKANKGASTLKLLKSIAEHAAHNSNVTLQSLADANGYHLEEDRIDISEQAQYFFRNAESLTRNIIIQELLRRGRDVKIDRVRYNFSNTLFHHTADVIITNAYSQECTACFAGSLKVTLRQNNNKTYDYFRDVKRLTFNYLSRFVFTSLNVTSFSGALHFFLAVFDDETYNMITEEFGETKVPADISIVHINLEDSRIVNEYMLPHTDKGHQPSFFMTTEETASDQEYLQTDIYDEDQGVFL